MMTAPDIRRTIAAAAPELRLLILATQLNPDATDVEETVRAVQDWQKLAPLLIEHSNLPRVWSLLQEHGGDRVPDDIQASLRERVYANVARSTYLTQKLKDTIQQLAASSIPVVTFKGPELAQRLYGSVERRRYDDLDFLVRKQDMLRVRDLMLEGGARPHLSLTQTQARASVEAGWELIFKHPDEDYSIEFDTGIAPRFYGFALPETVLWDTLTTTQLDGDEVPSLSTEALTLLLCAHGAKHEWARLLWIHDFAKLVTKEDIDWEHLFAVAKQSGAMRMLLLALALSRDLARVQLPSDVTIRLERDPILPRLMWQVIDRIAQHRPPAHGLELILFHLLSRERVVDRIRYVWRLAVTPSYADWRGFPLPEALFPLYYLTRPFRLFWSAIRRPFRH